MVCERLWYVMVLGPELVIAMNVAIVLMSSVQLLEAHDGQLRGLCLTASGSLLATASVKGTVLRVWNVATQSCIQEFRRGVERATITCLAFSWDDQWLSCCSDKGTAHVFFCEQKQEEKKASSLTKRLFSPSSKVQPKSVCQIRGIPHPMACAFIGDAPNILAVAGWDADGNGVLLISEFAAHQEARRIAYHVLVKNGLEETEEERRRRRARGWKPSIPETPDHHFGNLQISEPAMNHLSTNDVDDEDFCEVLVERSAGPVIDSQEPTSTTASDGHAKPGNDEDPADFQDTIQTASASIEPTF
jgi:WD domain, G-beta repeat